MTKKKLRKYKATHDPSASSSEEVKSEVKATPARSDSKPLNASLEKTGKITQIKTFFNEVRSEFTKISWANRKEVKTLTIAVFSITVFFTLYLGLVDISLSEFVGMLMKG